MPLLENYQNEILSPLMANRRQYRQIKNSNGTISFIDETVYTQEGSIFDANDINAITHQININVEDIEELKQSIPTSTIVTGIKGGAESGEYRYGKVILTAANIGTYTQEEIQQLIETISSMHFEIVDTLPVTDISTSTIYLVPSSRAKTKNVKDEFIYIYSYSYTDITDVVYIYPNFESFPSEGIDSNFYVSSDNGNVYEWNSSSTEYFESFVYTSSEEVSSLPSVGDSKTLYINTTDNKVYSCLVSGDWEQIGSTAIDLTDYYTKTEIDSEAIITTTEFENLE